MRYYAVIDTNVLVSAMLKWNSVPGNVLELAFSGTIIPLLNEHIVKEYREVLGRPKFHLTQDIIEDVVGELERLGVYVDAEEMDIELPEPKDRVFYEVVMEERKSEDAYNLLMPDRDAVIEGCTFIRRELTDCAELDAALDRLNEEAAVVAEMVKACVQENATAVQSQEEYEKRYNGLVRRYETAVKETERLTAEKEKRQHRDRELRLFIKAMLDMCVANQKVHTNSPSNVSQYAP